MQKRKSDNEYRAADSMFSSNMDTESDAKKVRLESGSTNMTPSCVLHLRRLPTDVSESEVANLAVPFGTINKMVLTKKNGQALIELTDQDAATDMMEYYSDVWHPTIRGSPPVIMQYSKYTELTTASTSAQVTDAINNANKQANRVKNESVMNGIKCVIRVQLDRAPPQSIGYMPFYKIFSQFGELLRIIYFQSAQKPTALIEFRDPKCAHVAKLQASGMSLFPESPMPGILLIDFSKQNTLEVRSENDNCRDFINNPLSDSEKKKIGNFRLNHGMGKGAVGNGAMANVNGIDNLAAKIKAAQYLSVTTGATNLIDNRGNVDNLLLASVAGRVIQPLLAAAAGRGSPVDPNLLQHQLAALQQLSPSNHGGIEGVAGIDVPHRFHMQNSIFGAAQTGNGILQNTNNFNPGINAGGDLMNSGNIPSNASPVVIVSGLDVSRVNPDTLFILFGVYGDVQRVKIMYSKKDTALVQYTDAAQAASAVRNLNSVPLYGNQIRCNYSKHFHIKMPQSNDGSGDSVDDAESATRDYKDHRLHRFKRANSRNHQNIYPPSCILHVSNLPDSATEEEISQLFSSVTGSRVEKCKLMANEKKMALVQLESIDQAVAALIDMHDYQMTENSRLRVSFSKSTIR